MYVHNYINMIIAGVVAVCVPIVVLVSLIRLRSERRSSKEAEALARNGDHSGALAMYLEAARAWSFCKAQSTPQQFTRDLLRLRKIVSGASEQMSALGLKADTNDLEAAIAEMIAICASRMWRLLGYRFLGSARKTRYENLQGTLAMLLANLISDAAAVTKAQGRAA